MGKLKFSDFIRHHLGDQEGDLVEIETQKKMGSHKGYWYYTIGQRQGLGLAGGPWYVVAKDIENNIIFISNKYYTTDKSRDKFIISKCNWIMKPEFDKELRIKLRHGSKFNIANVQVISEDTYKITLKERDQGIAPGQFAVLYDDQVCLGSGVITYTYDK